jgi:ribosomal protein S12 methylthiotransferase
MLTDSGYEMANSAEAADLVMVNTCAFIEQARQESVETILDLEERKRPGARTVVLGCMAQRFGVEVERALPEVDLVLGLDRYAELVPALDRLTGWRPVTFRRPTMDILHATRRPRPQLPYAYVKVAEGCDKPCTFCAIPLIRGRQRSRQPENVAAEVKALAGAGVAEVVLVAQDLAAYGRDLETADGIVELVRMAAREVERVRLLYLYPKEIRPELIDEICGNPAVASYFDLSLQHAAQRLLRAMKRPGNGERFLDLIRTIRTADPLAALRSSFIVGFPGETDDQVEELAAFLESARLDWAGFFPYSAEEGTPAAVLDGQIPSDLVAERLRYLQAIQDDITAEANLETVGTSTTVLIDEIEEGKPVGRSYREAPEIDGVVVVDRGGIGDWVDVEITAAYGSDRTGTAIG